MQTILDEFNRTNQWGIHVQVSSYEGFGRLDEAVESAIISDTLPDVLVDYGYQAQHWDGNGVLADLTPYVNDPVWGLSSDEQADFYPDFWAEDLVKSKPQARPGVWESHFTVQPTCCSTTRAGRGSSVISTHPPRRKISQPRRVQQPEPWLRRVINLTRARVAG